MGQLVLSNAEVQRRSVAFRDYLNDGKYVRLYSNVLLPTPATLLAAFTEASFVGYLALTLDAKFNPPVEFAPGQWRTISNVLGWTCTAGSEVLRGLYVTAGDELVFSRAFEAPFTIDVGNPYFTAIEVWDWARVTLPC